MTDKEIIALYEKLTGIKSDVLVSTFLNDKRNVARGEEKSFSKCLKCDTPFVCAMRNICATKSK